MVSRVALIGLVILVIGLIVGIYGVYTPVSAQKQSTITLLNAQTAIDANDYASKNIGSLTQGQTISYTASISNTTTFFLYVMDQTQYYNYYGCAPFCYQPLLGGSGNFYQQAGESQGAMVNISTLTPSSSKSGTFTAPADGTYYFVMDNSIGPNMATYIGSNASTVACGTSDPFACNTVVNLQVTTTGTVTTNSANWTIVGIGIALLIIGGAMGTAMWGATAKPKKPATAPATPATTTPTGK